MLAPVVENRCARLEDQLGLDDEANSQIADGSDTGSWGGGRRPWGVWGRTLGSLPS
jgi:hypothetical protein